MMRRNPIFIHPQPMAGSANRRSRRAEHVREQRAQEQKSDVFKWSRFAFHRQCVSRPKRRTYDPMTAIKLTYSCATVNTSLASV